MNKTEPSVSAKRAKEEEKGNKSAEQDSKEFVRQIAGTKKIADVSVTDGVRILSPPTFFRFSLKYVFAWLSIKFSDKCCK